ncbi:MAG: tetratricopeptide repeat protein [Bacteroidota bacterium]
MFCLVFGSRVAWGQNPTIDSLTRLLKTSKPDTLQVNLLNKLSEEYDNNMDLEKAKTFANKALSIAKKINNLKGMAKALDNLGNAYSDQGKNKEALKNYYASLGIKKEIGNKKELAYTFNLIGNSATSNEEALSNYEEALKLNTAIGLKKSMATNYNNIGLVNFNQGNFSIALDNYSKALTINQELGNKKGIAYDYDNIGICYGFQGNYPTALKNIYASLKLNETLGDKNGMLKNYNNIGIVNQYQLNYSEALKYYTMSLKLAQEMGDKTGVANAYTNIGNVNEELGNFTEALKNQNSALKINQERGDKIGIALNYVNIGLEYKKLGDLKDALANCFESLKINEELGDKNNIANAYINIGDIYLKMKNNEEANKYLKKGLEFSKETGNKYRIKESYNAISLLDSTLANWKSAYDNNKLYYLYRDSLINEVNTKKIVETQMKYEFNKKEDENKLAQEKKNVIIAEEKHRQRIITIAISIGLLIVIIFSGLLYNRFKLTLKQKHVIELQKMEVEEQKELVDEKNKQVTDSINYAKRIQTALMPSLISVKQNLPQSFIIYIPKDIVAGDFYWMETSSASLTEGEVTVNGTRKQQEHSDNISSPSGRSGLPPILFAACDCTGHGVPGALVSVVCNNALTRAVREFNLQEPAAILDKTEEIVTENFAKNDLGIKDGMDVSLCSLNLATGEMQWAGANNPLWVVTKKDKELVNENSSDSDEYQLLETKADKQPIGRNENHHPFTNNIYQLKKNDTIYLFTDGFADQFGGETGKKKITRKRFKELLISVQHLDMEEQKKAIETYFYGYKKEIEQIDDILIFGVRV